jgi:hypothetical protein
MQYRLMNEFLIEKRDYNFGKDNAETLDFKLNKAFNTIIDKLAAEGADGCTVVSHTITQLKGSIVLSVLVGRE